MDTASSSGGFPAVPASWYYLGTAADLKKGPVSFTLPGSQSYVGYRTSEGRFVVLTGRCCHMKSDLSKGCVNGDRLACPLHGWEFGPDGMCRHIPNTREIPEFARLASFPVEERGGHVFFFNRPKARFPLPFFEGVSPGDLCSARCFELVVDAPWYLVGANGFDAQHFRFAHDRALDGDITVDCPDPFARRFQADFLIAGDSLHDRIMRRLSGPKIRIMVTSWGGNIVLAVARLRITTSRGFVNLVPLEGGRTLVRNIVWVPRRTGLIGRTFLDPLDANVRRSLFRGVLRSDVDRLNGIRYNPGRMIPADSVLEEYLEWLHEIHH